VNRLKDFLLIFVSAVFWVLPFHFGQLAVLSFVAFVPYFFVLRQKSAGRAAQSSFLLGFLFYLMLAYWLSLVNGLGFVLLAAYLALYPALFGLLASSVLWGKEDAGVRSPKQSVWSAIVVSALWVIFEFLRGWVVGGIPWALLAYAQWRNLLFIQIADWAGAFGVSFLVFFVNVMIFMMSRVRGESRMQYLRSTALVLAGVLGAAALYGFISLSSTKPNPEIRVSVIQGNIPQEEKWNSKIKEIIFEKYKRLTFISALERPDLIVWPETSFPGYLEDEPVMAAQLRSSIRKVRVPVLVGAPTLGDIDEGLRFFNSAVLYGADGEERRRYSKVHLVPFGEYVPFDPVFGILRNFVNIGRFSPGREKTVFELPLSDPRRSARPRFSVLICYEDIFPWLVRDFCNRGANFLVNISNDAWFGRSTAPYQHAQASVFRAIENRTAVVRATNTGFSCVISPEGKILAGVQDNQGREIFVTGHRSCEIPLAKTKSFYTRFGDVFAWFLFFLVFVHYRIRMKEHRYSKL
jgi:apolipoprotein N-acyltransferase